MAIPLSFTGIKVEFLDFPATVSPSANSDKSYFLGGAGERGLVIDGNFIKFTGIGVYLENKALPLLASKWKGKSVDDLLNSNQFFRDIITGPYEKLIRGSKILPLDGSEYVKKVSENCIFHLKSVGTYSEAEQIAIHKLIEAFKDHHFPPGSSVFYKQSPKGTLTLSFSKDGTLGEDEAAIIENKAVSESVLETMIGEHAVSPALKQSLATRLSQLFNDFNHPNIITSSLPGIQVEFLEFPATVTPPAGSVKSYFLGGAGVRGLVIDGNFIKFTGIGVYLEDKALPLLASNWKGKGEDELCKSLQFFRDIITGPYEKLIRGSKILPLGGEEYVKKVSENCVEHLKRVGTYDEEEAKAIEQMIQAFKGHHFKPGSSVFYKQSPNGTLTISFSEDATLPEDEGVVIKNKAASMAVLETMIGEHAVSPALKQSLAARLSQLFNHTI